MSTSSTSALRPASARGTSAVNSPAVDTVRRRLQATMPYGAGRRIAIRLGRPDRCVYAQLEGEHPLTLDVSLEALQELPDGRGIDALGDLLAPAGLAVIDLPDPGTASDVIAANGLLLAAVGAVEGALAIGLADGHLDAREAAEALRAVVEARVRLDGLERRIAGSGK